MIGAGNFSKTLLISYQTPRHHKQSNGYFAVAFYRAVLLLNSINLLNTFYYQLTHTTLKNVVIKNSKIDKNAPTCFGLHGNHLQGAKVSTWLKVTRLVNSTPCPKKIVPFFIFFLGAQCVESGVSCTDCY